MQPSERPPLDPSQETIRYTRDRGRIKNLLGLKTAIQLGKAQAHRSRAIEATEKAGFEKLWGKPMIPEESSENSTQEDDMETTVLGDYIVTNPAPPKQSVSRVGPALVALALGACIPGAGAAGWVASQYLIPRKTEAETQQSITPSEIDTETVNLGLGRIQDYLTQ